MNPSGDYALVQRILDGEELAWHDFVHRYTRLIGSVLHRYLPAEAEDHRRTVYVEVLALLREEKLAAFDGTTALSTWVTLIARRACVDDLRRRFGRKQPPKWLEGLERIDQELYRLSYIEGLGYPEILDQLKSRYPGLDIRELTRRFDVIRAHIGRDLERRLAFDLWARRCGVVSGRLLEFVEDLRDQTQSAREECGADRRLRLQEQCEQLSRLARALATLEEQDRDVLDRFYHRRQSAKQIAKELGLARQRRAYTLVDRAMRRLRSSFAEMAVAGMQGPAEDAGPAGRSG